MNDKEKEVEYCDNHPDRKAAFYRGNMSLDGGGYPYFRITKRLCEECDKKYSKINLAIEYIR